MASPETPSSLQSQKLLEKKKIQNMYQTKDETQPPPDLFENKCSPTGNLIQV